MHKATDFSREMGQRIQQARKAAGHTQSSLSEKMELTTQYVSDLERGVVGCSIATLIKLCDELDVSADFILRGMELEPTKMQKMFSSINDFSPERQELVYEMFELMVKSFFSK